MASTHRPLLLLLLLLLNLLSTTAQISTSPEPLWTVVASDDPYAKTACSIALSLFNSEQQVKDRARVARTYLNGPINVLLVAFRVVGSRAVYIVQIQATESHSPKGDGGWKVTVDMSFALPVYGPFQLDRVDRESFQYRIQRELP